MILIPNYGCENYIIPEPTNQERDAVENMIYCRETHDPCDQGCSCKTECKRKKERLLKEAA